MCYKKTAIIISSERLNFLETAAAGGMQWGCRIYFASS